MNYERVVNRMTDEQIESSIELHNGLQQHDRSIDSLLILNIEKERRSLCLLESKLLKKLNIKNMEETIQLEEVDVEKANHKIAIFCGAKTVPTKGVNIDSWIVEDKTSSLRNLLHSHLAFQKSLKFHSDWNWIMCAITEVAKLEGKPLIATLCKIAGKNGDSITDVFENTFLYIENIEKESKL